jgi:tRNA A64-2'-O-ribosylphosphate transferase
VSEGGYIQGAGDDAEGWSSGLTPPLFWSNQTKLLATNEEDLPEVIKELLNTSQGSTVSNVILIKPTSCLYVGSLDSSSLDGFDTVISCGLGIAPEAQPGKKVHLLQLKCRTGKLGSRDLREELPKLEQFFLNLKTDPGKILIRCATGKDLSLGVALSILCLFSEDNGTNPLLPSHQNAAYSSRHHLPSINH